MYLLYQGNTKNWDRKSKKNKNSLPTAREDGSWQSLRLCRLLTEWQSAKMTMWMASTMACLCRLQEIPVGKGTSLPSVEKKQLAKKIAVGKEPVSCSVRNTHAHVTLKN
jgi:hypothetical protein